MANFFGVTIFPNFSFLGVSVSNISDERTYVFSVSNFLDLRRFLILVYQRANINGLGHGFLRVY